MKIKKTTLLILAIFLFGAFLRFFKINQNFLFDAEQASNYLAIRSAILSGQLPLLGPPAAHEFSLGPVYYWLMMPLMVLFKFSPRIGACFTVAIGCLVILLNFFLTKRIFNQKVALISSFLIAASPFLIEFSRRGRFYFLVIVPFYLLLWSLYKIWQGEGRFLFWAGLAFGVMLNFHLSPIYLVPAILIILSVKREGLERKNLFLGLLGFLIPNLPFLIYDFTHGLRLTARLLVWFPYRLAGFLGFYSKNNLTPEVFRKNIISFFDFFSESFVVGQKGLGFFITVAILSFIALNFKKFLATKKKEDFGYFFVFWTLVFALLALFVHGLPPRHYFLTIVPVLIFISSLLLEKLWRSNLERVLILIFFMVAGFLNLRFFLSSPLFYASGGGTLGNLRFQEEVAKVIVDDAKGERFNLGRVGEFDYYPGEYAYNYRYILWLLGNEPSEEKVGLRYTIYEDSKDLPYEIKEGDELFRVGRIFIVKREEK